MIRPPAPFFGSLNVEVGIYIGNSNAGLGDCFFPNNTELLDNLPSSFVKEKADDAAKYVIEMSVSGTCSNGDPWTKIYKKGDFGLTRIGPNGLGFSLPNVPRSSSNNYTVLPTVLSPCVGSTKSCGGKTNYRQMFSPEGGGFIIENPMAGGTYVVTKAGTSPPQRLSLFQGGIENCQ